MDRRLIACTLAAAVAGGAITHRVSRPAPPDPPAPAEAPTNTPAPGGGAASRLAETEAQLQALAKSADALKLQVRQLEAENETLRNAYQRTREKTGPAAGDRAADTPDPPPSQNRAVDRDPHTLVSLENESPEFRAFLAALDLDGHGIKAGPIPSSGVPVTDATTLALGQALQVEHGSNYWAAEVISLEDDGWVGIHYIGWETSWDEIVPRSALQLDPEARAKAALTPNAVSSARGLLGK